MERAAARIGAGIALLRDDDRARLAFRIMNKAVARAARRRSAGPTGITLTREGADGDLFSSHSSCWI